jgi:tripartite-type tricarboxylate transporter receptor subunit TctC
MGLVESRQAAYAGAMSNHPRATIMRTTAAGLFGSTVVLATLFLALTARGETYPVRPIHFVLGSAPGSVVDDVTRQIARQLEKQTGQPVVVENRPSAGFIVALESLKHSPPDGYTLSTVAMPQMSMSPALFAKLPYDPLTDFTHVGILFRGPQVLVVNPTVPASTFKEFLALASSRPNGLRYSSPSTGGPSHVLMEAVRFQTGANLQHIPYKGPAANQAVLSGEVDALLEGISPMMPLISAGRLRPLAVTGQRRVDALPNVPTFAELGISNIDAVWVGVIAPRNLPPAIIDYLNDQLAQAVRSPDVRGAFEAAGRIVAPGSPREMTATIEAEIPRWRAVIKQAGIAPE